MENDRADHQVEMAANLTIAWLNNPNVRANNEEAMAFLEGVHSTLAKLAGDAGSASVAPAPAAEEAAEAEPAVTVRRSLASKEKIISMIDGKPYSTLKRHLSKHGLSPAQYRERFGLKADYPMVAPAYAEKRRELAKKIGLGRKPGTSAKPAASKPAAKRAAPKKAGSAQPRRRGRPPKAAAPATEA